MTDKPDQNTPASPAAADRKRIVRKKDIAADTAPVRRRLEEPRTTLHPMLNTAIKAARAAGSIISRASLDIDAVQVSKKQANDYVTEVDQQAEEIIIQTLLTAYPQHGILAEETGNRHGNPKSDHIWIIDPLDGTSNFVHSYPAYCVSIALQVKGRIEQAVVFDPTRNDLFTATRGRGAFLNDRRMRVGKRTQLTDCLVSSGLACRPGDDITQHIEMITEIMRNSSSMRRQGAAALDLAYVAAGFSDAYFEAGLKPWDVAAGSLLVQEAGGLIGNFTGDSEIMETREVMAANPRIYGQLVTRLEKYSKLKKGD